MIERHLPECQSEFHWCQCLNVVAIVIIFAPVSVTFDQYHGTPEGTGRACAVFKSCKLNGLLLTSIYWFYTKISLRMWMFPIFYWDSSCSVLSD